jgi:2-dehydro-3-deoxyphosphogluconate aldolase/(4S)-4-hydroxy-2-oxoglutarate aldolase
MDAGKFKQLPVLGILRGGDVDAIDPLVETVVAAGLETIEIAMNTPDAVNMLRRMVQVADDRLTIGAGTVISVDILEVALRAGASFIVLPTLVEEVVAECRRRGVPVFPGAFTPQEIYNAWRAGAAMVKVFPAKFLGPAYFQEIHGPFPEVELLACGGVSADNLASYFASGASAVAFGASVFRAEWLAGRDFDRIGDAVAAFVQAFRSVQSKARS